MGRRLTEAWPASLAELRAAEQAGDGGAYRRAAHQVKGAVGSRAVLEGEVARLAPILAALAEP